MIPARGGSKGIKKKNLRLLNNKPLVTHAIEFAKRLNFVDTVVVNSDNTRIINISKKRKVDYIKRSKKLSGDKVSDYDLLLNTLNFYKKKKISFDYLIYLQPTSPFRKLKDLNTASKKISKLNLDAIWSVNKVSRKYHPLKLFKKINNLLFLYSKKGKKIVARQQLNNLYQRNGIFYIFKIKSLLNNKSLYFNKGILPYEIKYKYVNIDNLEDLTICKKLFKTWSI